MSSQKSNVVAIIVGAGRGVRAGGDVPKQWQALAGRRVADWSVDAFLNHPDINNVVLVHHPDDAAEVATLPTSIAKCVGGETRGQSVLAGLEFSERFNPDQVLIHDIARPCVTNAMISDCLEALRHSSAAALGVKVQDAIWHSSRNKVSHTVDRTRLWRAQTPQAFAFNQILQAHQNQNHDAKDDVEVAREAGIEVTIIDGDDSNLKITTPSDFLKAAQILRGNMDIRVGNGFDVHRFEDGDHVILCGIKIPHEKSLKGHSDADVAMHAITDAIYGALAQGDIGQHFPPSDPKWAGADSSIFLRHAANLASEHGYTIQNIDCTIVCEMPKIGPVSLEMRENLSKIINLSTDRISVKATTSEKLGFTGRGEGISSLATATLVSK